ncbi:hypothetical protein PQR71_42455, partial [Paraburkholderia fungorum]
TFEVHGDVGLKGGGPKPVPREFTDELKQEVRGLFNEGKTHKEVSEQLGLPLGQVRQFARAETARWRISKHEMSDATKQEILKGIRDGLDVQEVASRNLMSASTVRKVAKEAGVAIPSRIPVEKRQKVADMLNEGFTPAQVGRQLGIDQTSAEAIGREYHVVRARTLTIPPATKQRAAEMLSSGMTVAAVADTLALSRSTVQNIARQNHIALRSHGKISEDVRQEVIDRLSRGQSQKLIARELKISTNSIQKIANRHRLDAIMTATFAGTDPQQIEALASNLDRRMPGAPGSPQPGTSTGGETRQPAA